MKTFVIGGLLPFGKKKGKEVVPKVVERGLGWLKEMDMIECELMRNVLMERTPSAIRSVKTNNPK